MFTIVIPTIWKSEYTLDLLQKYQDSPLVSEIILINNLPEATPKNFVEHSKIIHYKTENLFVNPSWNVGLRIASNENVLISNDDIIFDVDANLQYVLDLDDFQAIGVNPKSYNTTSQICEINNGHYIGRGWGCAMFVKKSNWIDIPENLKIWFGDDWIAKKYSKVESMIFKGRIETKIGTSSESKSLRHIIDNDIQNWNKLNI